MNGGIEGSRQGPRIQELDESSEQSPFGGSHRIVGVCILQFASFLQVQEHQNLASPYDNYTALAPEARSREARRVLGGARGRGPRDRACSRQEDV